MLGRQSQWRTMCVRWGKGMPPAPPPRGGAGESNPPTDETLVIQQTSLCHTRASALLKSYSGDDQRACSAVSVQADRVVHGTPDQARVHTRSPTMVESRQSMLESVTLAPAPLATHSSDERGWEVRPSTAHGHRGPWEAGSVESSCSGNRHGVSTSGGHPRPGHPGPSRDPHGTTASGRLATPPPSPAGLGAGQSRPREFQRPWVPETIDGPG